MKKFCAAVVAIPALLLAAETNASDACSTDSIRTRADVRVSDGTTFRTETWYHLPDATAIRHIRDDVQLVAIDGPFGWAATGERTDVGEDFYTQFAIGHQFHAILLRFDEVVTEVSSGEDLFDGEPHTVRSGNGPFGGMIGLVLSDDEDEPAGLLFELPGAPRIEARFSGWRAFGEHRLPSVILIDDTEREFEYRYSDITVEDQDPLWYFDAVPAPASDEIGIYRLHRRLLAAHCMGDARMMADLSLPDTVIANRGELRHVTRDETTRRFTAAFERFDYTAYTDMVPPIVSVSGSGDLGWIAVNVVAAGNDRVSGEPFSDQWAWIMLVQKVNGAWRHAGNASSLRR